MKRFLTLILSFAVTFALAVPAFAASNEAVDAANALHELGLFNGTGTDAAGNPNFDLDRAPNRYEAVTMLVRLLGKEADAKAGTWNTPFTDVADWAKPYVGYAYANGLTTGTSATAYGGSNQVTASQYLTFILRALGYQSGTDFQWDKAWELSDQIGLTDGSYNAGTTNFTRGDVARISKNALTVPRKQSSSTLLLTLLNEKAATQEQIKNSSIPIIHPEVSQSIEIRYVKDGGNIYIMNPDIIDGGIFIYYDAYTGTPYIQIGNFCMMYSLYSGNYKAFIEPTDISTFLSGGLTLMNEETGLTSISTRREVSLQKWEYDIEITFLEKTLSWTKPQSLQDNKEKLELDFFERYGLRVYVFENFWGVNHAFNLIDLLDFFDIDPEIRVKFENIKIEENTDGQRFIILD